MERATFKGKKQFFKTRKWQKVVRKVDRSRKAMTLRDHRSRGSLEVISLW